MSKIRKKKVTFLIETLDNGGAERVTALLANEFYNNNFEVSIIILWRKDNEYFGSKDGIKKYYIDSLELNRIPIRFIRVLNRVRQIK